MPTHLLPYLALDVYTTVRYLQVGNACLHSAEIFREQRAPHFQICEKLQGLLRSIAFSSAKTGYVYQ